MENITVISVHAACGLAVAVFVGVLAWRASMGRAKVVESPPALPLGKVPVWLYRPADLIGLALVGGVFYLLGLGNAEAGASDKPQQLSLEAVLLSIGFQLFMAAVVTVIVLRRLQPADWLGLRWKQWPWVLLIAPATVFAMWMFMAVLQGAGYMALLERLGVEMVQDTVRIFQKEEDPLLLAAMGFAAAVVAPVCEEVVFRGYLYPVAKRYAGLWVAALCTALVFAAAHGSLSALLPLFVFGLVLVALYEYTGSIWAPMAVHFLFNSATVAIQILLRYVELPPNALP